MLRGLGFLAVVGCIAMALSYLISLVTAEEQSAHEHMNGVIIYPLDISFQPKENNEDDPKIALVSKLDLNDPVYLMVQNARQKMEQMGAQVEAPIEKRSMAIGRNGWRPGKRFNDEIPLMKRHPADRIFFLPYHPHEEPQLSEKDGQPEMVYEDMPHKKSLAIGRSQWRPGKRAMPFSQDFMYDYGYQYFYFNPDLKPDDYL